MWHRTAFRNASYQVLMKSKSVMQMLYAKMLENDLSHQVLRIAYLVNEQAEASFDSALDGRT
jgi:hypothetical protein